MTNTRNATLSLAEVADHANMIIRAYDLRSPNVDAAYIDAALLNYCDNPDWTANDLRRIRVRIMQFLND